MYVSLPKNYSGVAFAKESAPPPPQREEPILPQKEKEVFQIAEQKCEQTENEKTPLSCFLEVLRGRKKKGLGNDDFLLIGLIALLASKEGNEDIVLILALLLIM